MVCPDVPFAIKSLFIVCVVDSVNTNMFHGPMGSLPFYIFSGLTTGTDESITRAWAGILVLLVFVIVLFVLARFLGNRKVGK